MIVILFREMTNNDNVMDTIGISIKEEADVGNNDELAGPTLHLASEISTSNNESGAGDVFGNFEIDDSV